MGVNKETFLKAKPKLLSLELPDLGITVNIIKGTWATWRAVQQVKDAEIVEQLALILADDEGNLLFTEQEDIKKLESIMTISDTNLIMDKWRELNGISKPQLEEATKNSNASTIDDSASA